MKSGSKLIVWTCLLGNCSHDYALEWEKGKMCSCQRIHCESLPYRTIASSHVLNGLSCSMNHLRNSTCHCFYGRSFCQRLEKKHLSPWSAAKPQCDNVMISDDGSFNGFGGPRLNHLDPYLIKSSRPSDTQTPHPFASVASPHSHCCVAVQWAPAPLSEATPSNVVAQI